MAVNLADAPELVTPGDLDDELASSSQARVLAAHSSEMSVWKGPTREETGTVVRICQSDTDPSPPESPESPPP